MLHYFKSTRIHLFLLGCLLFFAYASIFDNQFFGDDFEFLQQWPTIQQVSNWPTLLSGDLPANHTGVYRPIRSMAYLFVYQMGNQNLWFYHAFSFSVHLLATVLVYFATKEWLKSDRIAFLTALLFGLHPSKVEAITYITASFDTLGAIFFLASLLVYFKWRSGKKLKKDRLYLSSVVLAGLAFGTNEALIVLPAWLVIFEYFSLKSKQLWKDIWSRTDYFWFVLAGYILLRLSILEQAGRGEHVVGVGKTLMVSLKSITRYIEVLVFPQQVTLTHDLGQGVIVSEVPFLVQQAMLNQSWSDISVIVSIILIVILFFIGWAQKQKKPFISISIFWFLVGLLPVANIIPSASFVSERYMYVASLGFFILVAYWLNSLYQSKFQSMAFVITLLLAGWYGFLTYQRNLDWDNTLSLWQAEAEMHPTSAWNQFQLGEAYQNSSQLDAALTQYQKATEIYPDFSFALNRLALLLEQEGEIEVARELFDQSVNGYPQHPGLEQDRKGFYERNGKQ